MPASYCRVFHVWHTLAPLYKGVALYGSEGLSSHAPSGFALMREVADCA